MISSNMAYNLYMTTKKHFTDKNFDVFASNQYVKIPAAAFQKRPEKYRMERYAKKFKNQRELVQYYAANFALDNSKFVYEPEEDGDVVYAKWVLYKQSMSYNFRNDVEYIVENLGQNSSIKEICNNQQKKLLELMLTGKISIQTLSILETLYKYLSFGDRCNILGSLFSSPVQRVIKAGGFIRFDEPSIVNVLRGLEVLDEEAAV